MMEFVRWCNVSYRQPDGQAKRWVPRARRMHTLATGLVLSALMLPALPALGRDAAVAADVPVAAVPVPAVPELAPAQVYRANHGIAADPALSKAYLKPTTQEVGNPRLTIGHYNAQEGLLAAYQSETGKRIIFTAKFGRNGRVIAQVLHIDPVTQKIVPLVGKSKQVDESGQPMRDIEVAGVDILAMMQQNTRRGSPRNEQDRRKMADNERQLKQFMEDETGQALLDGLPALYAALEEADEAEPQLAKLKEPLGAIVMALQVGAKHYRGFKNADQVLGSARSQAMRDACRGVDDCSVRSNSFIIHRSGLFDVLSKHKGAPIGKEAKPDGSPPDAAPPTSAFPGLSQGPIDHKLAQLLGNPLRGGGGIPIVMKNGNGMCDDGTLGLPYFGLCGPGSITPGNIETPECIGHDYCVCAYSHAECLFSPPEGCGLAQGYACYSLVEAIGSYIGELWDAFVEWIREFFEGPREDEDPCEGNTICVNN